MRILYHHRTRATDAQGIHIAELVKAFRELGHAVDVFSLAGKARQKGTCSREVQTQVKRTTRAQILREVMQLGYNIVGLPWVVWRAVRWRADFIYERYSLFNFSGVLAARLLRKPIILEVNSPLALEQYREGAIRSFAFAEWSEKVICNLATHVLVVSTPLRRILVDEGVKQDKIVIMLNGVDSTRFAEQHNGEALREKLRLTGKTVIGFSGWFKRWHGLELLVEAFRAGHLADRGAALLLIGDGPATPDLRSTVRRLGLDDAVVFTGPVPHHEMPSYLSLLDVAVQPAANEYCCPMKLLEYMAIGKAIVAPDQENIRDLLEEGEALFFTPGDATRLSNALVELTTATELRSDIARRGCAAIAARRYEWRGNANRVTALFREGSID